MTKKKLEYEGFCCCFWFVGESIAPIDPETYDASAFTLPTKRLYKVDIMPNGNYQIWQNGASVKYGYGAKSMSKAVAKKLIIEYLTPFGEEPKYEDYE